LRTSWTGSHPATPKSNRDRNETVSGILNRFIFATPLQKNPQAFPSFGPSLSSTFTFLNGAHCESATKNLRVNERRIH
jgi:hypothetical protein